MRCSQCGYQNLDDSKFCGECGNKLEIICPNCNSQNPLNHKFCNECGQNLSTDSKPLQQATKSISEEEKLRKIQKYLPEGIADKILAK